MLKKIFIRRFDNLGLGKEFLGLMTKAWLTKKVNKLEF